MVSERYSLMFPSPVPRIFILTTITPFSVKCSFTIVKNSTDDIWKGLVISWYASTMITSYFFCFACKNTLPSYVVTFTLFGSKNIFAKDRLSFHRSPPLPYSCLQSIFYTVWHKFRFPCRESGHPFHRYSFINYLLKQFYPLVYKYTKSLLHMLRQKRRSAHRYKCLFFLNK